MSKRMVFVVLGLVTIAVGVAGIALNQVSEYRQASLKELELLKQQEQLRASAAEEQRKAEEERRRIEELAKQVEVEKRKQVEEQRRFEEDKRRKQAEVARTKEASPSPSKSASQQRPKPTRSAEAPAIKKAPKAPSVEPERRRTLVAENSWQAEIEGATPKRLTGDYDIDEIRYRAGREAAMLLKRVVYSNPATGDRVRAEPVGHDRVNVRVRVRIWEERDLVCDSFMRLSRFSQAY